MSTPTPTAFLLLNDEVAHKTARAMLMASQVAPTELAPQRAALRRAADTLQAQARSLAIIETAALPEDVPHVLALADLLGPQACARVFLVRGDSGPVWDSDRQWLRGLGYAGVLSEISPEAVTGFEFPAVQQAQAMMGVPPADAESLGRFLGAMQIRAESRGARRARVRQLTGQGAEDVAMGLADRLPVANLRYRLTTYPECVTGEAAAAALMATHRLDAAQAEALGLSLQRLGMLHHVAYEQPFAAGGNFFRFDSNVASRDARLGPIYAAMREKGGPAVADRRFLARTYERCFVGSEAVAWVTGHEKVSAITAENVLNRLMGWGLIVHVTREHPMRNDNLFYRFVA